MVFQGIRLFAACALAFSAMPALAQPSFGPDRAFSTNGIARTVLTVPPGDTGARTLTVEFAGDLSAPGETVVVRVEGRAVGTLGGAGCGAPGARTLPIDDPTYTAAAADGAVSITFDASAATTPVDAFCGARLPYTGRFTGLNDGFASAFAVQGTLAAARTAPATPVTRQVTEAATRGTLSLTHGPDRSRRIAVLDGGRTAGQAVSLDGMTLMADSPVALDISGPNLSFAAAGGGVGLRLWAEGRVLAFDDAATRDQTYAMLHTGVETVLGDSTLLGVGLTFDRLSGTDIATGDDSTGTGWMLGPALTHRFGGGLYLDGRAALGRVSTRIDRSAGGTDRYDADRSLVDLALVGQTQLGALTVEPRAAYGWYQERAESYVATGGGPVQGQTTTVHQGSLGARLSTDLETGTGRVMPFLDLSSAFADISGGALVAGSAADALDGWSGQIGLGADFAGDGGAVWSAELGLGGLGTDTRTVTGRLSLSIPF